MNNEEIKELFITVFSNECNYTWTKEYKKKYIYAVQQNSNLDSKKLPENIIDNCEPSEIYDKISVYDKDLLLFKNFHRDFEFYSKKSIEIYKLHLEDEDIKQLKREKTTDYDLSSY